MYTVGMSWRYRAFVLSIVMGWGLAPQLACFVPDAMFTQAERDCCEKMAAECGGPMMTHTCCRTVVRTDAGIATKLVRHGMPVFELVERTTDMLQPAATSRSLPVSSNHGPPDDPSLIPTVLRI